MTDVAFETIAALAIAVGLVACWLAEGFLRDLEERDDEEDE